MIRLLALLLALAPLAACSNDSDPDGHHDASNSDASHTDGRADDDGSHDGDDDNAGFGGPIRGEVLAVEANAEDELEIGVTDQVLFLRLTDAARKEVRKDIDQETPDEGIGGVIGRAVGGIVNDALATTVQIPLEDVDDLRYADGRLFIDAESGVNVQFNDDEQDGIPYDEGAAERLIDAFERAR